MKVMNAVKKLKFWSRKKRKRKSLEPHNAPPPVPHYCRCRYSSAEPSAPPLPPWLDHNIYQLEPPELSHYQGPAPEIVPETTSVQASQPLIDSTTTQSYQQYMVPNPVYGIPLPQTSRKERSARSFGCAVDLGMNLIRCFCPCFHVREACY